ncbi:MAG: VWA domain-containing protein [Acidobacteriaceae bacterium]
MVQGRNVIWTATLAVALTAVAAVAFAATAQQKATAQQQTTAPMQQQAIPDAPRPQTLPDLRTITPVGASVTPPAALPTESPSDGQAAPGTSLPSVPAPVSQVSEQDQAPPLQGKDAFVLPSVQVNFIEIPFTVKDSKGQLVPGLSWRDIQVYENNVRQRMAVFTTDPFPLSVAIVIDQSVTFDTMEKINSALGALQGAFTPYDEVAIFTYNNGVKEQTPFTAAQSARLGVILERSKGKGRDPVMGLDGPLSQTTIKNNQQVDPNTSPIRNQNGIVLNVPKEFHTLNDAILAAAVETTHAGKGRRRIVYVISDGKEYGSKAKQKEVVKYCLTNKVSVWATLVGESSIKGLGFLDRIHLPLTMRDDVLPRFAGATGGQIDSEFRQKGIESSFARITAEVRNQYTVGYYSREPMIDGKYRNVDVRVLRPNMTVIAKGGYYPTAAYSAPAPVTPTAIP